MSHFTHIKLQIKDIEVLKSAVEILGYKLLKNTVARGYSNKRADYVICLNGPYDVAVVHKGDAYNLEADFYQGYIEEELGPKMSKLVQEYGKQFAFSIAEQNGFTVNGAQEDENGNLKIELEELW